MVLRSLLCYPRKRQREGDLLVTIQNWQYQSSICLFKYVAQPEKGQHQVFVYSNEYKVSHTRRGDRKEA